MLWMYIKSFFLLQLSTCKSSKSRSLNGCRQGTDLFIVIFFLPPVTPAESWGETHGEITQSDSFKYTSNCTNTVLLVGLICSDVATFIDWWDAAHKILVGALCGQSFRFLISCLEVGQDRVKLMTCVCFREQYWPARSRKTSRYDSATCCWSPPTVTEFNLIS